MRRIGLIVEGHSEVEGLPVLLRLLAGQLGAAVDLPRPFRVKRTQIVRPGEVERSIARVIQSRGSLDSVLLVLDSDDDDATVLEADLTRRGQLVCPVPFAVVAAVREFEAWLLACKPSLSGVRGIRADAAVPAEGPEAIRDAKGRLTSNMENGRRYVETDDQAALVARMDIEMARANSPSFGRLCAAVEMLALLGAQ